MKLATLREMYDSFNLRFFRGVLTRPVLRITKAKGYYGKFLHPRGKSGASTAIYVSGTLNKTEAEFEDTLLHEMIHQYLYDTGVIEQDDHGPIFREHACRCGINLLEE